MLQLDCQAPLPQLVCQVPSLQPVTGSTDDEDCNKEPADTGAVHEGGGVPSEPHQATAHMDQQAEDLALPQLHKVTVYTELHQVFQQAHFIILLDDSWPEDREGGGVDEEEGKVRKVSDRYQQYGRLINERVHMNVAVIVAGDSLVNLKCSLLLENAPSVDSGRFVGMATQLEYEAKAHIAQKLSVKTADVTEVIVWGNISGSSHVDLQSATVFQYEGAIWGPSDFSQPVLEIIYDRKWLQSDFLNLVSSQCATVASKSQRATAISATNGIIAVLKAWNCHSSAKEVLSFCILSTGQYNLPAGVVFSMPVSFQDGRWSMLSDVIGDKKRAKLQIAADQLREEKDCMNLHYFLKRFLSEL
ncbi:putative malate dehydrogenase 1B [Salmo trutta]|uniref:putative malate dehydrogenase 1B n=1 Tax=Salmo trutta TaxID=8032 RepID=UPI00113296E6|nr:putative malate dehydrogenase 1B [Salmo trutta]